MSNPGGSIRWLGLLFGAIGLVLASVSLWLLEDNRQFTATARRAEGTVTRMERSIGGARENSSMMYAFVQFLDGDRPVEIRSRTATSPPAYSVGDKVSVLYQPGQAEQARIESFAEQYFLPLLFGGLGIVFGTVAGAIMVLPGRARRRRHLALTLGTRVTAKVIEVRLDPSIRVNRQSPWVIVAEFPDESQNQKRALTSHRLWADPQPYYPIGSDVTVYFLPEKPAVYAFELDRLPEPP